MYVYVCMYVLRIYTMITHALTYVSLSEGLVMREV